MNVRKSFIRVFLVSSLIITGVPLQAQQTSPTLERGIGLYKHENFDEALPVLKKARSEEPRSSLAAYYLGLTYKQLQKYDEAIASFKDAITYSPKISGALIELIDCYYRLEDLDNAKTLIAEAEKENVRPGQTAYFKGLILAKTGDTDAAIASFNRAMELDNATAQACTYQIGLLNIKKGNFEAARQAFQDVRNIVPTSDLAYFAQQYLDTLGKRGQPKSPFRFTLASSWQYDDNVVLKPDDSTLASNITNESDSRQVYYAQAEYNRQINKRLALKAQYLLYYGKQNDLGFYDTMSHTATIQPGISFKNGFLSFPTGYSYTFVDERSYLSAPFTGAIYNFMTSKNTMAQIFTKYQNKNYYWAPSTPQEDRDSNTGELGAGYYVFYAQNKGFVNLRYGLNKEWTQGDNWEYAGFRPGLTALVPITKNLNLTLAGDFYIQNFSDTHSLYNVHRRDKTSTYSSLLSYKLSKNWDLQLQYTHIKDNSNIPIYKYTRNIYSAGLQVQF